MADKWYDSDSIRYLGIGLAVGAASLVFGLGFYVGLNYSSNKNQTQPVIQEADINGNGISDKFYIIDGKIAVTELDGKSISQSLERNVLGK